jgi:hypothetical protein
VPRRPVDVADDPGQCEMGALPFSTIARCWIADRTSGWRKRTDGPSTSTSRASTAGAER